MKRLNFTHGLGPVARLEVFSTIRSRKKVEEGETVFLCTGLEWSRPENLFEAPATITSVEEVSMWAGRIIKLGGKALSTSEAEELADRTGFASAVAMWETFVKEDKLFSGYVISWDWPIFETGGEGILTPDEAFDRLEPVIRSLISMGDEAPLDGSFARGKLYILIATAFASRGSSVMKLDGVDYSPRQIADLIADCSINLRRGKLRSV